MPIKPFSNGSRTIFSTIEYLAFHHPAAVVALDDDVKLHQSLHPLRSRAADVGMFFTIYAKSDRVWLAPAWLEGREVIAVLADRADPKPNHIMWLEWREGWISFIRDYRYVSYIAAEAELVLGPDARSHG